LREIAVSAARRTRRWPVNRVLTLALHSPQVHGFFSVPVDHLHALRELATHLRGRDLSHATVVSPDLGYAKSAAAFARRLSLPVAAGAKERISDTEVRITAIIGDVAARDVIVLDDEIARHHRVRAARPAARGGSAFGGRGLHARPVRG
jgi:phosphoribosylpyrophosphate synthetase